MKYSWETHYWKLASLLYCFRPGDESSIASEMKHKSKSNGSRSNILGFELAVNELSQFNSKSVCIEA